MASNPQTRFDLYPSKNTCDLSANEAVLLRSNSWGRLPACSRMGTFDYFFFWFSRFLGDFFLIECIYLLVFKQANRWQRFLSLLIDVSESKSKWSHGCLGYLFSLQMIGFFFPLIEFAFWKWHEGLHTWFCAGYSDWSKSVKDYHSKHLSWGGAWQSLPTACWNVCF